MPDDALLSDLCSICNISKSKYRCPGCSARTCSLSCYKRHQQWAQCSGQRDPTKFVKKSQLVTPAGIDHDFNFLTGIERDIKKAQDGLEEENEVAPAKPRSWSQQAQKTQTNYQHLQAAGVKVIRAPKGLSRQKENKSHRSNTKKPNRARNILWTVEWLDDQKRRLLTETSSSSPILEAQPFAPRWQNKDKKRKRNIEEVLTSTPFTSQDATPTRENPDESFQSIHFDDKNQRFSSDRYQSSRERTQHLTEEKIKENEAELAETHSTNDRHDGTSTEPVRDGERRFYLVKPRTSSNKHVLIPLTSTATLGESLNGRTVLEFPTIYVFPSTMQQLPENFILEEDYLKEEGEDQREFDELISELDPEILKRLKDDEHCLDGRMPREQVNNSDILDVLKKDFGSVV